MGRIVLIEELYGHGNACQKNGSGIGEVDYHLSVYQNMVDAGTLADPTSELPGLKEIRGWVEGLDNFSLLGKPLSLELEDGRFFDFFIQNSKGEIAPQGGLYEGGTN